MRRTQGFPYYIPTIDGKTAQNSQTGKMDKKTSAGRRKSGKKDLMTIREERASESKATETFEMKEIPIRQVQVSSKEVRLGGHRTSSTLTFFDLADKKSRRVRNGTGYLEGKLGGLLRR